MQLRITWEEIMKRWPNQRLEVLKEPVRVHSSFVKGYEEMMVVVPKRKH
jgi:cytochrome P450